MQVVVTASSSAARVAASAVSIDNATGDTKMYALTPANISFTAPVVAPPTTPGGIGWWGTERRSQTEFVGLELQFEKA